jgi:hypothetical protein
VNVPRLSALPRPLRRQRLVRLAAIGLVAASVSVSGTISVAAAADGLPKASVWNGKYPFDMKPGFYETPGLKSAATALIGAKRYKQVLVGWSVAAPIATDGDALLAWGCKPHDCGDNHQSTLIDAGQVAICITQGGTATWYAPDLKKPAVSPASKLTNGGCQFQTVAEARQSFAAAR